MNQNPSSSMFTPIVLLRFFASRCETPRTRTRSPSLPYFLSSSTKLRSVCRGWPHNIHDPHAATMPASRAAQSLATARSPVPPTRLRGRGSAQRWSSRSWVTLLRGPP
ncbi:hypothetical protein ACJRO7_032919 [Eucalyptus globulus]|uniref:Secreted protein n=1 Tax=Eucalyptus globulus TaxID=34317 RepID=A0ABD3JV98_EUCGL